MSRVHPQAAILLPPPPAARYLEFDARPGLTRAKATDALGALHHPDLKIDGTAAVVGLGSSLTALLGLEIAGLVEFPRLEGSVVHLPATPHSLWIWLRGEDRGELLHRSRAIVAALADAFTLVGSTDAFTYDGSRDLTGYEDGTENPQGEEATAAAVVTDASRAPVGSSFVAVQKWRHDLDRFAAMSKQEQDFTIGRERLGNEELDEAPDSAHVKRTAQEDFDPPAFVVRRSMPWAEALEAGLVFVAFGCELDRFERLLRRMSGLDDGIVDNLYNFTRPETGACYWCPPVAGGRVVFLGA